MEVIAYATKLGIHAGFDYLDLIIWSAFGINAVIVYAVFRSRHYLGSHG